MRKRELVASMVTASKSTLSSLGYEDQKTVSVKIRIHRDLRETVDFVRAVEKAGVDFITIHGRTRSTRSSIPVDLSAIKLVAEHCTVPVLANGDVFSLNDAHRIASETGVDGVMAARGLLENPALFDGKNARWEVVEMFLNRVLKAPIPFKLVVHHITEMCGSDRGDGGGVGNRGSLLTKEERMQVVACGSFIELIDLLDEIRGVYRVEGCGRADSFELRDAIRE